MSFQGGPYQSSSESDSPTPGDSDNLSTVFGFSQNNLHLFPGLTQPVSSPSSSTEWSPPHSPSVSSFTDEVSDDNDHTITTSLPHSCVVPDVSCSTVTEIPYLQGDQSTSADC